MLSHYATPYPEELASRLANLKAKHNLPVKQLQQQQQEVLIDNIDS